MSNEINSKRTDIAQFFKNKRLELGISQRNLAIKCNMCEATINRMEQGKFWLGTKQYLLICDGLGIKPTEPFEQ
jgi:transcriptional regulator with XRE-family HTH domain